MPPCFVLSADKGVPPALEHGIEVISVTHNHFLVSVAVGVEQLVEDPSIACWFLSLAGGWLACLRMLMAERALLPMFVQGVAPLVVALILLFKAAQAFGEAIDFIEEGEDLAGLLLAGHVRPVGVCREQAQELQD